MLLDELKVVDDSHTCGYETYTHVLNKPLISFGYFFWTEPVEL